MLKRGGNYVGNTCRMNNNQIKNVRWAGHLVQLWAEKKAREN